jgi:hypothetical protein
MVVVVVDVVVVDVVVVDVVVVEVVDSVDAVAVAPSVARGDDEHPEATRSDTATRPTGMRRIGQS